MKKFGKKPEVPQTEDTGSKLALLIKVEAGYHCIFIYIVIFSSSFLALVTYVQVPQPAPSPLSLLLWGEQQHPGGL